MNTFSITEDNFTYVEDIDDLFKDTPLGYYPRIIDTARALMNLRKQFDAAQAVTDDDVTQYHDSIYPLAIVLEIDGEPMGTVRIIDDAYQWVPFKQVSRTV